MDIRFFRHIPSNPEPEWPRWPADTQPAFTLVALQRNADPDATDRDGYDYFGAYGDATAMEAWAAIQDVDVIGTNELPKPLAFYPPPFATTPALIRARWPDGTFRSDDPSTPDINEAWVTP